LNCPETMPLLCDESLADGLFGEPPVPQRE